MPVVQTLATFPAKPGCAVLGPLALFLLMSQVDIGEDAFVSSLELHEEIVFNLAASMENNLYLEQNKCKFLGV